MCNTLKAQTLVIKDAHNDDVYRGTQDSQRRGQIFLPWGKPGQDKLPQEGDS